MKRRRRSDCSAALAGLGATGALALLVLVACSRSGGGADLVVYCSLDQVFSEELIARFEDESGLRVRADFDVEASKTVGLVRRLLEERGQPRCDVFWNNEIAQTVRLAEEGLLERYASPAAATIPVRFKDPEHRWTGFAARARVLIVNTELADPAQVHGMGDLLDPRWRGRCVGGTECSRRCRRGRFQRRASRGAPTEWKGQWW